MKRNRASAGTLAVLAGMVIFVQSNAAVPRGKDKPVTFVMPDEIIPAELSDAGAEIVVANCTTCHSLEYITTQPRGMGGKYWDDAVTKMVKVYGAPIETPDADAIAETLARRFG